MVVDQGHSQGTNGSQAMIRLFWLCTLPVMLSIGELWAEQVRWHDNYAAIHKLFLQQQADDDDKRVL